MKEERGREGASSNRVATTTTTTTFWRATEEMATMRLRRGKQLTTVAKEVARH